MDTNNILRQQLKHTPQEVKDFLAKKSWSSTCDQVSIKYTLTPDQRTALENEVLFVILGMELETNFEENIQTVLGIPENTSREIAREMGEGIFAEISTYLPKEVPVEEPAKESVKSSPEVPPTTVPEIPPANLPAIKTEEPTLQNVPEIPQHKESLATSVTTETRAPEPVAPKVETPEIKVPSYKGGADPYREPIN